MCVGARVPTSGLGVFRLPRSVAERLAGEAREQGDSEQPGGGERPKVLRWRSWRKGQQLRAAAEAEAQSLGRGRGWGWGAVCVAPLHKQLAAWLCKSGRAVLREAEHTRRPSEEEERLP